MKKSLVIIFIVIHVLTRAQNVETILGSKIKNFNLYDIGLNKSGYWLEKSNDEYSFGVYLNNLKSGIWINSTNYFQLQSITVYNLGQIILKAEIEINGSLQVSTFDTIFVYEYLDLWNYHCTDSNNVNYRGNTGYPYKFSMSEINIPFKNGISCALKEKAYSDRIYMCFEIPLEDYNYMYMNFSYQDKIKVFQLHEIYETKNMLLNGAYYLFKNSSNEIDLLSTFKSGYLDGLTLIFKESNTFPVQLFFKNGKIINKGKTKKINEINEFFELSRRFIYPKEQVFHPWYNYSIEDVYFGFKSIYSGFRGTVGNENDFERIDN